MRNRYRLIGFSVVSTLVLAGCPSAEVVPNQSDNVNASRDAGGDAQGAAIFSDGIKNGSETDVDCGGTNGAIPCGNGKQCLVASDCTSVVCTAGTCVAPTKSDGVKNGTETDVDCGGGAPTNAPTCLDGAKCVVAGDCGGRVCTAGTCVAPTNSDDVKNGTETDVDCGGGAPTNALGCGATKICTVASDCASLVCTAGRCVAPTKSDEVKNGTETDVDCGGSAPTSAPRCATAKRCLAHTDCVSDGCNAVGKCASQRSCAAAYGGDTCGAGEDCCTTVMGAANLKIEKYVITAGRFRQFVERTNGDLRGWLQTQRQANNAAVSAVRFPPAADTYLPIRKGSGAEDLFGKGPTDPLRYETVAFQLGPYVYGAGAAGANEGCFITDRKDEIGARTYWLPPDVLANLGVTQKYTAEVLDQKSLNCVTYYMLNAFCAWDGGGRLPTYVELDTEWGPTKYPWGTEEPGGFRRAYDTDVNGVQPADPPGNTKLANYFYNYWNPMTRIGNDYSAYIAKPGSFRAGNSQHGVADLAGHLFNMTSSGTLPSARWHRQGSWQGHVIPFGAGVAVPATNKYWAMGGRCVR
jgi:formylglycine-generating enzyme required for sulfatase activity